MKSSLRRWLIAAPLCAAGIGLAAGAWPLWLPSLKTALLWIGQGHLQRYEDLESDPDGTEYLLVLNDNEQRDQALAFIAADESMRYLTDSIYPQTLVLNLPVPVGDAVAALEAQPFTKVMLPVLPLFFCH